MYRILLFAMASCCALADTVSVAGTCQQNPCQTQITDQFGDPWAYASTAIEQEPTSVIGAIYTSLGLTSIDQQMHPGATAPDPSVQFSVVVDLPRVPGTLDVFLTSVGKCDEYEGCDPVLHVSGLQGGVDMGEGVTEYFDVPPIEVTLSGLVTTGVQDSSDQLGFNLSWVDPPAGGGGDAPEPGWLGGFGLALLIGTRKLFSLFS